MRGNAGQFRPSRDPWGSRVGDWRALHAQRTPYTIFGIGFSSSGSSEGQAPASVPAPGPALSLFASAGPPRHPHPKSPSPGALSLPAPSWSLLEGSGKRAQACRPRRACGRVSPSRDSSSMGPASSAVASPPSRIVPRMSEILREFSVRFQLAWPRLEEMAQPSKRG
jgi:hypothetical protein